MKGTATWGRDGLLPILWPQYWMSAVWMQPSSMIEFRGQGEPTMQAPSTRHAHIR